jgi:hypothetical protein
LGFQGHGYSPAFIKNFADIKQCLDAKDGDQQIIHITQQTDSICAPCPHRRQDLCEQQQKIQQLDDAHTKTFNWENNTTITWGKAKQHIKQQLTLKKFQEICQTCSWQATGLCEKALRDFGIA